MSPTARTNSPQYLANSTKSAKPANLNYLCCDPASGSMPRSIFANALLVADDHRSDCDCAAYNDREIGTSSPPRLVMASINLIASPQGLKPSSYLGLLTRP